LEKPSARTKIAVEITSEDVKSFTGKMQPIISHLSPIVQFHNIREQEGKSQHNASVEFSIPRTKRFHSSKVTFEYTIKVFLNQQLVEVHNPDKVVQKRLIVLQHYAKDGLEYNVQSLRESIPAGGQMTFDFKSSNALRGIGQWDAKSKFLRTSPGHTFSSPEYTVYAKPKFDVDESNSGGTEIMTCQIVTKLIKSGHSEDISTDVEETELQTLPHTPTAGLFRICEQTAIVGGKLGGEYELTILQDGEHVPCSPFVIRILPLDPDPKKTSFIPLKYLRADKPGLRGESGVSSSGHKFLLVLRDKYWNIVSPNNDEVEWAANCLYHRGNYSRSWSFHVESLENAFEGNGQADFKPALLSDLAHEVKKAGLSRSRLAAAQIIKEKQYLERLLLVANRRNDRESYGFHYSNALKCPLIMDEKQCQGLHIASIPHGNRGTLRFENVFLITRRPLRGLREPVSNSSGLKYRPSILLNSTTYLWFPYFSGDFGISLRRIQKNMSKEAADAGANRKEGDVEEKQPQQEMTLIDNTKPIFSVQYQVRLRGSLSSEVGTIRWLLRHKIFKKEKILLDDILIMNVWPGKFQQHLTKSFVTAVKEKIFLHEDTKIAKLKGLKLENALKVEENHKIITDIQYFKKIWPSELNAVANFTNLEHVELLVYVAKAMLVASKFSDSSHEQFCSNLSLLAKSFNDLNTRTGYLSSKSIRWRSDKEKTTFSVALGVITSIFEVFEKKMVELNGQKIFFQWWKMQNMDSKSLKAIKSFQTLDLSGVREFTCRFGNGPLGIQFGDGVRKDGESYVEVIEKLPEGQGMGYDELQKGDRVVRIGARPIRGMDFDNVISIIKSEKRPLEITFIHGDNVSEASKKDIVVSFQQSETLGITFGDAVDQNGDASVEVVSIVPGSKASAGHLIKPGDIVANINGVNVRALDFLDVLKKMQTTPRPMEITFSRELSNDKANISMYNFPPGPLGISFGEVTHPGSPSSAELVSKIPGTTASEYDALRIGDFLVQVGSYAVHDVDFAKVMELVRNQPRPVKLYFTRDKNRKEDTSLESMKVGAEDLNVYSFKNESFGILLAEKTDDASDNVVYVDKKTVDGEAQRFPSLNVGDILVRIDSYSVRGLTLEEVTETLKNVPDRPLDLGFIPGNYINNTSAIKENYSCKFPSGPYGMELGDINVNGAVEIEVVKVDPKGAAARTNLIKPHDRIVRIGNVHVSGMPFAKLVTLLQDAKRPVEIGFKNK
jgi:C-terminal processing protease CtpA/Prc